MSEIESEKVVGVVVCDFLRAGIGTRSRLADVIAGLSVLQRVLRRLMRVEGLSEMVLLAPPEQMPRAQEMQSLGTQKIPLHVLELTPRSPGIDARLCAGRRWNLNAWRGGAGQWTVFDEDYHPAAIAHACKQTAAAHVLLVHSHGIFLDVEMTSALVQHHLHKNHEMKMTYTPAAPGLCGMLMRADIALEMGDKNVMPWQLLAYDPNLPAFDTLIREACMQVDPAVSKIPNRFCVDTDRGWHAAEELLKHGDFGSAAELALAGAHGVAPGVRDLANISPQPQEVEIELTGRRLTSPPGSVPALIREGRGTLDVHHWTRWLERQKFSDDMLLTFGGDGDPLLYPEVPQVLQAARSAGAANICVQTDLASVDIAPLLHAVSTGLFDVLSVTCYGHLPAIYAEVAQADLHAVVMQNLAVLAPIISARGGVPLVVPRLLKVRQTIPEMEDFFDAWIRQSGWAVIDGPTDRAGAVPFEAVVDMAPPKRKACRRLWDRMLIRANGTAVACDQDIHDRLALGNIESMGIADLWQAARLTALRTAHAAGRWAEIDPCRTCREWHRS